MAIDLEQVISQAIAQSPLAGAAIWVAKHYMAEHKAMVDKLIGTFESNNQHCREDYKWLLEEFTKFKENVLGGKNGN